MYGDKISCLHLSWTSKTNEKLEITADLAVCYQGEVIKRPRHFKDTDTMLRETFHITEQQMMRELPLYIRNGFILAKAVRIASIAQPDNTELFELQEAIKTVDVISSFVLKACLFGKDRHKEAFNKYLTPHDVSTNIYERLQNYLNAKEVKSEYSRESPVNCFGCQVERGSCKRRNLMLAMVRMIIKWLEENKDRLQDIDFADHVDLGEKY